MNPAPSSPRIGRVASLHLHPATPSDPLHPTDSIELVIDKGIVGNGRYFGKVSRSSGQPSRRQVTLIAREQIAEHAVALGLESIPPGVVRSNIETFDLDLLDFLGQKVAIGGAILHFYEARTPCQKMDAICLGLRERMTEQRQGILAEVIQPGIIRVGDSIRLAAE